jgi:hypothetical protein
MEGLIIFTITPMVLNNVKNFIFRFLIQLSLPYEQKSIIIINCSNGIGTCRFDSCSN